MISKEKIEKGVGYLLSPPSSPVLALVIIDNAQLMYWKEKSGGIEILEEIKKIGVDMFFVFTPYSEIPVKISHLKFTSLMEAKGFIDLPDTSSKGYWDSLEYILKATHPFAETAYSGISVIHAADFNPGATEDPEEWRAKVLNSVKALLNVVRLDISLPVLEIERNSISDLMFQASWVEKKRFWERNQGESRWQKGMFRTYNSPTIAPFLRPVWIGDFLKTVREREPEWLECFWLGDKFQDIIASGIKYFGMGWLDRDPVLIDLQKQTEIPTTPNVQ